MMGGLSALILLGTVYLIQTAEVPHQISLTVVELGDNVTLQCVFTGSKERFSWNKQSLGFMVQAVATAVKGMPTMIEPFKDSRFTVTAAGAQSVLIIRNVSKEDEGTYFCQSGGTYSPRFANGTFLAVNDHNQQKSVHVEQSPETASVQLGDSVTLQCSLLSEDPENREQCPGEHRVSWFRAGSEGFHPAIIYSHSHKERSCVYSLSKTIRDYSDTGTYYCAVSTCGGILFGDGTKVDTRDVSDSGSQLDPVVLVLGVLLVCCVTVIIALIFYVNPRKVCEHCKEATSESHHHSHDKPTVDQSHDLHVEANAMNYAALDFTARKGNRGKKKRAPPQECVYSDVRADRHNQPHLSLQAERDL